MTDFITIKEWELRHGEIVALELYSKIPNPDGTAPDDYKLYAHNWGHPAHKNASGASYGLAA